MYQVFSHFALTYISLYLYMRQRKTDAHVPKKFIFKQVYKFLLPRQQILLEASLKSAP